jgi:VIT1/CCC1 family predicted Fe2+/Mn2+ transporter
MTDKARNITIKRYLLNWNDELNAVFLYGLMAQNEENSKLAGIYRRLADTEQRHADIWACRLKELNVPLPTFRPSWRTRALGWLIRRFGVNAILPSLSSGEDSAVRGYSGQPEAAGMLDTERSHAVLLRQISMTTREGLEGGLLARLEGRHKAAGGNALRAGVLGASDGLLSNFNLLMGVAGASMSGRNILLTGLAGLLAGGISMALGEWISVKSSRELYERQIGKEQEEITSCPQEEAEELVLIYQARGMDEATARTIANKIMSNPATAIDTLAREELGINPEDLGGSAHEAAIVSFLLFATGAIVPVIPYMISEGAAAVVSSALLSATGLFIIGAMTSLFTGRSVLYTGGRQVIFGLCAAAVSFFVGRLIGVSIT